MRMHRVAGAVALSTTMAYPVAAQHFPPSSDLGRVLRFVVEDGPAPGAVLGVLEADGTISVTVHGSAGEGAPQLVPNSTFEIGSITKTFTATLLAEMVLRGEVALDDPVRNYLPEGVAVPSAAGREVTLLDLATHRSGLPNTPPEMQVGAVGPAAEYTHEDAYRFLAGYDLPHPPGAKATYSNFGYALLGHALSNAVGQSYEALITSRILEPLGMMDTGFSRDSTGSTWTRGSRSGAPARFRTSWSFMAPAGALYAGNAPETLLPASAVDVEPYLRTNEFFSLAAQQHRIEFYVHRELQGLDAVISEILAALDSALGELAP